MKFLTQAEALASAMRKYHEIFPAGSISSEIEQIGALSILRRDPWLAVVIIYAIKGETKPYILFHANVNTLSGEVILKKAGRSKDIANRSIIDESSDAKLLEE